MTQDQIVLLGTKGGPAIRQGGAMPTSSLLQFCDQNILIDCGIGVARSVVEAGVSLLDLDAIFITHLHSDHVLELGPMIYTAWTTGLRQPINIYGPIGLSGCWLGFLASMQFDHEIRIKDEGRPNLKDLVLLHEVNSNFAANINGIEVTALRVDHPPVTECYALRFNCNQKSVVFSADTCYFPPLGDFARNADVLVHEAMLMDGIEKLILRTPGASRLREHLLASHTKAEDVGRIATAAGVGHLCLNHLVPSDDPEIKVNDWIKEISKTWNGQLTIGHDGIRIPF